MTYLSHSLSFNTHSHTHYTRAGLRAAGMGDAEGGEFLAFVPRGEARDGAGAFVFPNPLSNLERLRIGEANLGGLGGNGGEQKHSGENFHGLEKQTITPPGAHGRNLSTLRRTRRQGCRRS